MKPDIAETLREAVKGYMASHGLTTTEELVIHYLKKYSRSHSLTLNPSNINFYTVIFSTALNTNPRLFYNSIPVIAKDYGLDPERCNLFKKIMLAFDQILPSKQQDAVMDTLALLPLPHDPKDQSDLWDRYITGRTT